MGAKRSARARRAPSRSRTETAADQIRRVARRLARARVFFGHGTDNAYDEAAWLVAGALNLAPEALNARQRITPAQSLLINELVALRIKTRKPLAYLLREAWFAGLPFYVDERVIVPRSLTGEFIRERFAPWVDARRVRRILDLCTGGGCMAVALAHAFPRARVEAVDISPDALAVARLNVARHALDRRVKLLRSDLFAALGGRRYDLIVSNPPYVAAAEMRRLPLEYRREPRLALAAGTKGLAVIVRILRDAHSHLTQEGILVVETGNARAALERAYPDLPLTWLLAESGDESVFLLPAAGLHARRSTRGQL